MVSPDNSSTTSSDVAPPGAVTTLDDVALLRLAAAHSEAAWGELTARKLPILRNAGRRAGLSEADIADVVQSTWLALLVNIDRLRQPECINGWLAVTARREAVRCAQRQRRSMPLEDETLHRQLRDRASDTALPEQAALSQECRATVRRAVRDLPSQQRRLVELQLDDDGIPYRRVAELASVPLGSIGPTRRRALDQLSRQEAVLALRG